MIDAKKRKVLNGAFSMIIGMDWKVCRHGRSKWEIACREKQEYSIQQYG